MGEYSKFWSILVVATIFVSCFSSQRSANSSSKTGWSYNNMNQGAFFVNTKFQRTTPPGLVPIEGGTFVMGASLGEDVYFGHYTTPRRVTIPSFYMDETEVSNTDWREYVNWIKRNFPTDYEYQYESLPDTLVWRELVLANNEPYVYNYFRHPAYQDYPVVGVTWEQATDYCQWRTDRANEKILRDKGILKSWSDLNKPEKQPKKKGGGARRATAKEPPPLPFNRDYYLSGKYVGKNIDGKHMPVDVVKKKEAELEAKNNPKKKGGKKTKEEKPTYNRPVGIEDGTLTEPYRLPTEAEWEYAALGLLGNSLFEVISENKIYPWNGLGVRSPEKHTQGMLLANFKRRAGDYMGTAGYLNDGYAMTAPVKSFPPNDFGLYSMAGNVSEWTRDVYRQLTPEDVDDYSPFRGNDFTEKKYSDPSKGELKRDKHGRAEFMPARDDKKISWAEKVKQVAADEAAGTSTDTDTGATSLDEGDEDNGDTTYDPNFKGFEDQIPEEIIGNTTLISNKSRVYKGASWDDRAYWLNPATRRYLDQDKSSARIGFRCAMSMVGDSRVVSTSPRFRVKSGGARRRSQ